MKDYYITTNLYSLARLCFALLFVFALLDG